MDEDSWVSARLRSQRLLWIACERDEGRVNPVDKNWNISALEITHHETRHARLSITSIKETCHSLGDIETGKRAITPQHFRFQSYLNAPYFKGQIRNRRRERIR
ncbi:hypothetical protein SAMN06265355_11555 [Actinomadura mexicana]|uniref:Uncharacterized protein n=1 Tax=Actinomadura mexicana TaxID=134959 RepID=A0A239DNC8_9ACTN|nr:hypothetical protein SAMN06265355_11555 [Actinomadura mexicana]